MRCVTAVVLALLAGCSSAPLEPGFVSMFDGKELSEWINVNGGPETWSVSDEMIVTSGHPNGVLRSKRMYENYILELDWQHQKEGGNSGLFVHSGALPIRGNCFTKAIEIQIMLGDDPKGLWTRHGDMFAIQGATFVPDRPHPGGWMRCLPSENRVKGAGEWNHYRVVSQNGSVKLEVNGKEVSGGTKCNPRKGYICLESEGAECHFRNIRIKELPSTNPPAEEISEADANFWTIYGGDLRGWKLEAGGTGDWKAHDWTFEGSGKGDTLWTEKTYGEFTLIVDWRSPKDGAAEIHIPRLSTRPKAESKPGEWHRVEVTMTRDRCTYVDNGKVLLDEKNTRSFRGPIGVQAVGGLVQFANVYIKELN
jgi:hypothetical protein